MCIIIYNMRGIKKDIYIFMYVYIYIYIDRVIVNAVATQPKTQGKVPCHTTTLLRPHSFLYAPLKALSPQRLLYGRPRPPKTVAQTYGSTGKTRIPPSAAPMGCPEPVFSAEVRRLAKLIWRPLDRPMDRHVGEMRSFTFPFIQYFNWFELISQAADRSHFSLFRAFARFFKTSSASCKQ